MPPFHFYLVTFETTIPLSGNNFCCPPQRRLVTSSNLTCKLLLGLVLLTGITEASPAGEPDIIAGPIEIPGSTHAYYLLAPSTVPEAMAVAATLDGTLVCFESNAELIAVREALSNWNGIPRSCWIGLSDETTEGDWRWSTGESRLFTSWATGFPSDSPRRNHAYMIPNGQWQDADGDLSVDGEIPLHSIVEVGDVDCRGVDCRRERLVLDDCGVVECREGGCRCGCV